MQSHGRVISGYGPLRYLPFLCDDLSKIIMKYCVGKRHYHNNSRPSNKYGNHLIFGYLFFLPSLFSEKIRQINKGFGRILLRKFSEWPQTLITKGTLILIHALHVSLTCNVHVNVCRQYTLSFPDFIRMKQTWLETNNGYTNTDNTNTEISTVMSDPNSPLTSTTGKMVLLQNRPTSLFIIQNAHLMQSTRFAKQQITGFHNMPPPPLSQQTKFLANFKQLCIARLISAVHEISEVCTAPVLTLCPRNCMIPLFVLTTSFIIHWIMKSINGAIRLYMQCCEML